MSQPWVSHPNVMPLKEIGIKPDYMYLVMPRTMGGVVWNTMRQDPHLLTDEVIATILYQAAEGLEALDDADDSRAPSVARRTPCFSSETLCRSGTGSVLSSLWPVDDEVAARFMERFYRYLGESPRDHALRRVQLECLDGKLGTSIDVTDPYFWAGFRLYEEPGRPRA